MKSLGFALIPGFLISTAALADPVGHDCVLWLRADQGVTTAAGGRVTGVIDQSGAGHHASNTTDDGPILVPAAIASRPAMRFSGGQWLALAGQVLTSQHYTIIAVVTDTRTDGSFREVFSNWNFNNNVTSVFFGTTGFNPQGPDTTAARLTDDVGGANQGQTGVGVITNRTSHFIFSGISRDTGAEVYQARTLIAGRPTPISPRNLVGPYVIGRQGPISEFWVGDIAEILVYDTALSRCELDLVYDDLNARYGLAPCLPNITSQPEPRLHCPTGSAPFTVAVGGGLCDSNFTYQWQIEDPAGTWQPLGNDPSPLPGGGFAFATPASAPGVSIGVRERGGRFNIRCIVTNSCGATTSDPATLAVCPTDFNCDGEANPDDLGDFINCYFSVPPCEAADFNADGDVNPDDLGDYINTFFGPPC